MSTTSGGLADSTGRGQFSQACEMRREIFCRLAAESKPARAASLGVPSATTFLSRLAQAATGQVRRRADLDGSALAQTLRAEGMAAVHVGKSGMLAMGVIAMLWAGFGCRSTLGQSCTSSAGESGIIVGSSAGCAQDDAFCELRADGNYCTGARPFICPEGLVRVNWLSCGYPEGSGGSGGGPVGTGSAPGGGTGGDSACEQYGTGGAIYLYECDEWLGERPGAPIDFDCGPAGQGGDGGQGGAGASAPALERVCEAESNPNFNAAHPVYHCLAEFTNSVCSESHEADIVECLTLEPPCNADLDYVGCTSMIDQCFALEVGTCFWAMVSAQNRDHIESCFAQRVNGEPCEARFMRCAWNL
jgi:hypothetical protein